MVKNILTTLLLGSLVWSTAAAKTLEIDTAKKFAYTNSLCFYFIIDALTTISFRFFPLFLEKNLNFLKFFCFHMSGRFGNSILLQTACFYFPIN